MLKIFKKEEEITFDEKEKLINSYYSKSKELYSKYEDNFYLEKDKMKQLTNLINELTSIKERIEFLEKVEEVSNE